MNVNNVNQIFNQKIQDINSRLPSTTAVSNKFQSILEETQLKNNSAAPASTAPTETINSSNVDANSLLKTMLSNQSLVNSISSDSSSSSLFPTSSMNSSITMIYQNQLLNALKNQPADIEK